MGAIGRPPTTKTELIVLVCVICLVICLVSGYFYYLIIQQQREHIKAKMSEVIYSIVDIACAVTAHKQELNSWPHCDGVIAIQTSLGVTFPKETTNKISSISVTSPRAEEVMITVTIKGIHSSVNGKNVILTGKPSERGILWTWGGTVPSSYVPEK